MFLNPYLWMIGCAVLTAVVIYLSLQIRLCKRSVNKEPSFSFISEVVEQERTRISSELHDELGTLLSVIHLDLELVMHESTSLTPYGETRLGELRKNLNLVTASIRSNIWNLSAQMFDQVDLTFIIRELCHKLDAFKGTHVNFVQSGTPVHLNEKVKLNLFRIVQELLTNTLKHSSAWNVAVHIHWDVDLLTISIDDDGSKYEASGKPKGGVGVINISKRAEFINAKISKQPLIKGQRTVIELKLKSSVLSENSVLVGK